MELYIYIVLLKFGVFPSITPPPIYVVLVFLSRKASRAMLKLMFISVINCTI